MHNLVFGHESYISTVAWTLEIEVQFYCLVPLLALLFAIPEKRQRRWVIVTVMTVLAAAQGFLPADAWRVKLSLAYHLQYFLAGFLLADMFLLDWKQKPQHSFRWDGLGLVALVLLYGACARRELFNLLFPFATLLLYSAVFQSRVFNAVFRSPVTTLFGGMCYTVYLFHTQIIDVTLRMLPDTNPLVRFPIQVALICICCGVFFLLVEKPCMTPQWPTELYARVRNLHARSALTVEQARAGTP
jgi:peptidoglycan/LPS O-acetylase OafA/YrhL